MKNGLLFLMVIFAVACGKSSGGGAPANNGVYQPGTPTSAGQPVVKFGVTMDICSKGALQIRPGTKMDANSAREYFRDYLLNADRMRSDLGYSVVTEYDRYNGQAYDAEIATLDGYDIANGRFGGQNSGWGR